MTVRGWCPGVLDPMETGDGWLLRVRLPGGAITAAAMRSLAHVAADVGSGQIEVTSRANVQIRGVAAGAVVRAAALLVDGGVASADAATDACRAVVANPLTGHDPAARCDTAPLVAEIIDRLTTGTSRPVGPPPAKYGVVVDDAGSWDLDGLDADLRVHALGERWTVAVRGRAAPIGATHEPADVALRATRLCIERGCRMDAVAADLGMADLVSALGLTSLPDHERRRRPERASEKPPSTTAGAPIRALGAVAHPDPRRANLIAAPLLGRVDAGTLNELADLVDGVVTDRAQGHQVEVRLTPDHSIAFCGVGAARTAA
ncbi:MAG: hypothetical protein WD225_04850, partial [Ilumatobacteraceae bacterium]